ncbi:MAG TPA: hypothetical protein VK628_09885, partial [Flavitalea sp.]|nr:hypothetical protein [Flavitalea sp.]
MKKIIFPLTVIVMLATACSKNNLPTLANSTGFHDDRRLDDHGGDDHGGDVGGGGGKKISVSQVPNAVMQAFNARYSSTTRVEWKKLDNGNYKVEFYQGAVKVQAIFSAAG